MLFEQLNPKYCKTYLIAQENDSNVIMVDPVIDHFNDYLSLFKTRNLKLTYVIDTHTHADHISAASALKDATECEYVMHEKAPAQCVSIRVKDGDIKYFNDIKIQFIHTPGHTKDSVSLIIDNKFLTGDFLFLDDGGGGRDDLWGGSAAQHFESLKKIYNLPDYLIVYPAHEYRNRQPSSFGRQKITNPHLKIATKDEFIKYLEDLKLGPADWMKDVLNANYTCAKDPKGVWIPADLAACEVKGTLEKGVNEIEVLYISGRELKEKLNLNEKPVLIDVREPEELKGPLGVINGVINIPIGTLASRIEKLEQYKDTEIVMICRSGARATTGAQILIKSGFENVKVLKDGMIGWKKEL